MPKDAEAWLAERGIQRDPIVVPLEPPPADPDDAAPSTAASSDASAGAADLTARDAGRLAAQSAADAALADADAVAVPAADVATLADDVAAAVAFIRRSTSVAPQSEGRIRTKLAERDTPAPVIAAALERARAERLVDDAAMAAALVAERRAKGHAVARIRRDLADRGFEAATITTALGSAVDEDPEAAAFAVARDRAERLTGLTPDAAHRRVVGYLVRRGYGEGLARKVAREAVFAAREREQISGH